VVSITPATEIDKVAKSLTYIYHTNDKMLFALSYVTKSELAATKQEATILRTNSLSTKMFAIWSKILGLDYLWATFSLIINELDVMCGGGKESAFETFDGQVSIMEFSSMELDPSKASSDDDFEPNRLQLQLVTQQVFKAVMVSESKVPGEFKTFFRQLALDINGMYPPDKAKSVIRKAIGGFFFLRFVIPALTTPHVYGLLPQPPGEKTQRSLILIGKLLQNIANGTLPGNKERYMQSSNDFISSRIQQVEAFFDKLANPGNQPFERTVTPPVPSPAYDNALLHVREQMQFNAQKLNQFGDANLRLKLMETFEQGVV